MEKANIYYVLWLGVSEKKYDEKWGYKLPNPDIASFPLFKDFGLGTTLITIIQQMQRAIYSEINIILQTNRNTTMNYYFKLHFEEVDNDRIQEIDQFKKDLGDHYIAEDPSFIGFVQSNVLANEYHHYYFKDNTD